MLGVALGAWRWPSGTQLRSVRGDRTEGDVLMWRVTGKIKTKTPYSAELPLSSLQAITRRKTGLELGDWLVAGITTVGLLFKDNKLMTFDAIKAEYDILRNIF
ncbi:hypothetical protein NDU88_006559 [Pleurodeles waltl]|uniref:Uncharacterized protein n=1 Tax=Pleurodeles waltl TaxID=8319 RepID=A0AAV7VR18_PLEWA|nr:hypothetical protein NDU88_006559 [Pleurodeles waltl]